MSTPNRHIIQRQTVWLDTAGTQPPFALQERISVYCRHQLPTVLETLFDRLADADTTIRLDQLVIDAGRLPAQKLEEELTRQIIRQVEAAFTQSADAWDGANHSDGQQPGNGLFRRFSRDERMAQQLRYFLEKGLLSAWTDSYTMEQADKWLRTPAAATFREELMSLVRTETVLFRRLIGCSSDETLVLLTFSDAGDELAEAVRQALAMMAALVRQPLPALRERFWLSIGTRAVRTGRITLAEGLLLFQPLVAPSDAPISFFRRLLALPGQLPHREEFPGSYRLRQVLIQLVETASSAGVPGRHQQELSGRLKDLPEGTDSTDEAGLPLPSVANSSAAESPLPDLWDTHPADVQPNHSAEYFPDPDIRQPTTGRREAQPEDALFVPMAGVVLLHPFLVTLFAEMGLLTTNRQWTGEAAAVRAVQVLAFLVTGRDHCPEYDMPLLKVLCGLPFGTVVSPDLLPTDTDRQLTTELLEAVIGHWEALGTVSPGGLREAFLQREGKLTATDTGRRLTVERKTLDILLSRLPWGVSMVKLPFMTDLLAVDWN
ncbi:hypothetical protein GCM10023187_13720 [Nibrella viscosa]|uniref:Uncharacterized protein n=1 Tax=Nibrella viscosa TaxID=1084524 RepID=A0ABP8K4H2_9BACT